MKAFVFLCFMVLIFLTAFTVRRTPAESSLPQEEIQEIVYEIHDSSTAAESPPDSAAEFIHELAEEFDPKKILLYIEEQCRIVGLNYFFALSLLQEENKAFFRLFNEIIPGKQAFEARNYHNNNGSSDLGLWQLNDNYLWADYIPNYWHHKTDFDWLNPYHNTYIAIRHIKWMYNVIDDFNIQNGIYQSINTLYWKTAMAYNAGLSRVKSGSLPQNTLDYASRVLERVY